MTRRVHDVYLGYDHVLRRRHDRHLLPARVRRAAAGAQRPDLRPGGRRRRQPDSGRAGVAPYRVAGPVGSSAPEIVCEAVQLIIDGMLDDGGTEAALADRIGMSPRHLRRLFLKHLGASPDELARSRRATSPGGCWTTPTWLSSMSRSPPGSAACASSTGPCRRCSAPPPPTCGTGAAARTGSPPTAGWHCGCR